MHQVLKALLPILLVLGLVIGVRIFFKEKAKIDNTAQKAATNETAKVELQGKERAASNAVTAFLVRSELHVTKTNVNEVGTYLSGLASAVAQAEKTKTNLTLSPQLQQTANDRIMKEFVPEAVRVLKEAEDSLPLARVEELNRIIVPAVSEETGRLIKKTAPAPTLREVAGSDARTSPLTHTPEQVAAYLIKLHEVITNANTQLGRAATTPAHASTFAGLRDRDLALIDKTIREIRKSPWTPRQFLAFRALVSDSSGALKPVRLTENLTPEQLNAVEAAFKSVLISGAMTSSPALVSVDKNSPAEVAKKLFEILAQMKAKREELSAIKGAGKDKSPEWWAAAFTLSADYQEELSKILRNVAEHGKEHWTAKELGEFLGQMKGANGTAFGALFEATCANGDPVIALNSRQVMEPYLRPLLQ